MVKRGESIVEVVVACGILSLLFASVSTLIVGTVRLNNDARLRMEAVSLAQTNLNEFVVSGRTSELNPDNLETGSCIIDTDLSDISDGSTTISGDIEIIDGGACPDQYLSDNDLASYLINALHKDKCSYLVARELADDETAGGTLSPNNFYVLESHVRWISKTGGAESYVIQKLQEIQ